MADLSEDVQTFIVQSLACYMRPSHLVEEVKANFDVTVSRQQVQFYNPLRGGAGKRLAERWRNLFAETRRRYDADAASIPAVRMGWKRLRPAVSLSPTLRGTFVMALLSRVMRLSARREHGRVWLNGARVVDGAWSAADY